MLVLCELAVVFVVLAARRYQDVVLELPHTLIMVHGGPYSILATFVILAAILLHVRDKDIGFLGRVLQHGSAEVLILVFMRLLYQGLICLIGPVAICANVGILSELFLGALVALGPLIIATLLGQFAVVSLSGTGSAALARGIILCLFSACRVQSRHFKFNLYESQCKFEFTNIIQIVVKIPWLWQLGQGRF